MIKKLIDNVLNAEVFKSVFIVAAFFYVFGFTSELVSKFIKIFILWGAVIFVKDIIKEKNILKNKKNLLLFGMLALVAISTLINFNTRLIPNIISLLYMGVEVFILSLVDKNKSKDKMLKSINIQLNIVVLLTIICAIASIIIYGLDIKGSVFNGYHELLIGNFEGRLWGIYGNPNTLGQIGLLSVFASMYLLYTNKDNKKIKIYNYVNLVLQTICIVLSNSRSTMVSLLVSFAVFFLIKISEKIKDKKDTILQGIFKNKLKVLVRLIGCMLVLIVALKGVKITMAIAPNLTNLMNINIKFSPDKVNETLNKVNREQTTSDVSNGRFSIWKSGFMVLKESPIFGVGPENVNERTLKYLPEKMIEESPKMSSNMHNIYLQILVSHGIVTFILFVAYILINIVKMFKYLLLNKADNKLHNNILVLSLIVCAILVINLFDSNLLYFFSLFMVAVFWISIGNVNKLIDLEEENNDKKKILFLIDSLEIGGAEKVLVDVVDNLDYSKFDVTVKTIFNAGEYRQDLSKKVKYETIFKNPNKWVRRIFVRLEKVISPKVLYYLLLDEKYDVEVAFLETISTRILSGSTSEAKKITWVHTDFSKNKNSRNLYKNDEKFIKAYKSFDKIVCVSESTKEAFKKITKLNDNICTIYNPIDCKKIINLSKKKSKIKLDENKFNIVLLGRLVEEKGYDRLLNVINKLQKEKDNFKVYIIGEGLKRKEIEEYIKTKKLEKYVEILGFQKNPYNILKQADLFISVSKVEGFSLALAEAMVLELPVMCTNTSGPNEIIGKNSEYGMLIENSEKAIYTSLEKLIGNNEELELIKNKVIKRIDFFDMNKVIKQIENILENG